MFLSKCSFKLSDLASWREINPHSEKIYSRKGAKYAKFGKLVNEFVFV
jgi:hypothetical protein